MAAKRTLHEQIAANVRASWFYSFLMVLLLAALGAVTGGVLDPNAWPLGAALAAALGVAVALFARYAGSKVILALSGAREATRDEFRVLDNVAEEMAIAAGIPKPKVMVIDSPSPNAFATGPDPKNAVVVFTSGILSRLDRDELQGVMAHEIAHVRNYDIRFMTTIAMVAGLIPLLAYSLRRILWHGGGRRSRDIDSGSAIFLVLAILLSILAPLFSMLLHMAVSRQREYLADATAAQLTRYPEGLARALKKIASDPTPLENANAATEHLYIVNPLHKFSESLNSLFSTHPPVERRIQALMGLMGNYSAGRALEDFSDMPSIPDQSGRG